MRALLLGAAMVMVSGCSSAAGPAVDGGSGDSTLFDAASDAPIDAGFDAPADDSGATACVALVNQYRAMVDAAPVAARSDEEACAANQAAKGAADLEQTGVTTFHKYFQQCSESYQNECWYSQDDLNAVIAWCMGAFWAEGPPDSGINHYSVMTDPKSTTLACGFAHLDGGGYWMTNDYY